MTKDQEDALVNEVWVRSGTPRAIRDAIRAAANYEREANMAAINALIKEGPLQGHGWDDTAQRNGVILAHNALAAMKGA